MRIGIEHRPPPPPEAHLIEVVAPRAIGAVIEPAENLLAALSGRAPFGLEIAATADRRRFLARADGEEMRDYLADQLAVAYPQADLRCLDAERDDPGQLLPGEQVATCALGLRAPLYLPLRIFTDYYLSRERGAQSDPVLGLLAALGDLPPGWRSLSQLVLRPARDDWSRPYLHLAQEQPRAPERPREETSMGAGDLIRWVGLLVAGYVFLQGYEWYLDEDWLSLGSLAAAAVTVIIGLVWLSGRFVRPEVHDPQLVRDKVRPIAYEAQLRLAVFAPAHAPPAGLVHRLEQIAAAYRQYNLAAGNGFEVRRLRPAGCDLRAPRAFPSWRAAAPLNVCELAGVWHLPSGGADAQHLERTTARMPLPLPETVAHGCRVGVAQGPGRSVSVSLADDLLRRHMLLVAKTRRGKSALLLRLARYLMATDPERTIVVVDPHRDLAEAVLGLVPPHRRDEVVYLNAAQRERPFGLNLLDVGLAWDDHQAVESTITVFKHLWPTFWGPRMENLLRWALKTLRDDNHRIVRDPMRGPSHQHTVLEVPHLITLGMFRQSVRGGVDDPRAKDRPNGRPEDPFARDWWTIYDGLGRQLQLESAHPILTKIFRFAASRATRDIIGQPVSTVDPADWVRRPRIVVVNTAKGTIGEDTSALIGSTLINLVGLQVAAQADMPEHARRRVTVIVDEFHALPGANYELLLSELAKYGLNVILATQSLARLDVLDDRERRALRALVFSNVDGLFAFNVSAEDARYLARELASEDPRDPRNVDEVDLVSLPDHACYARITVDKKRLRTFAVHLDPPPEPDEGLAGKLATDSARSHGRPWTWVEGEIKAALARATNARKNATAAQSAAGKPDAGVARDAPAAPGNRPRNDNRPQRGRHKPGAGPEGQQRSFDDLADEFAATAGSFPGAADELAPSAEDAGEDEPGDAAPEAAG